MMRSAPPTAARTPPASVASPGDPTRDAVALANRQQGLASDPDVSAFVSASAGSGKTKLLIDRLLRLMLPRVAPGDADRRLLPGTDPARIQCLTFTKAAAAEMAIRLQRELGSWVTLDDRDLDDRLRGLGCEGGAALRQPARALFARVLDLPGGMRIGTIHAFCQSLLRRFPVEAEVSPHFRLVEETDSRAALNRAWEEVLAERARARADDDALALLAGQVQAADAVRLLATLQGKAPALEHTLAALAEDPERVRRHLRRIAGIRHEDDEACVLSGVSPPNEDGMLKLLRLAIAIGPSGLRKRAEQMADWLARSHPDRAAAWPAWRDLFLTGKGEPRAPGAFVSGKIAAANPEIADALVAEAERVAAVEESRRAIRTVALTMALLDLSGPVLKRYADGKSAQGLVDYDDLIGRTLALLRDPGSAWVLYKLDGGIDHLLLDEVQDTSDLQWRIAHALTDEFFAGRGAGSDDRPLPRTVFAVGDYKQSIYSFQDADPDAFHHWHGRFRDRVARGGQTWREPELTVSFRSTAPVLALVDAVFATPDAARGVQEPGRTGAIRHISARPDAPGSVELWPLVPVRQDREAPDDGAEPERETPDRETDPWAAPSRNRSQSTGQQRLAEQLARFIAGEIGRVHETGGAPLSAGDVLVLVPRRSAFVRALIRALKSEGVPVATLVRTGLADQIAVRDLMALCDALLLPQDDLSVGCVLTSPLGVLSDDSLMALATDRGERTLWEQLRLRAGEREDWGAAWHLLSSLFGRVDFVSPHALLAEALGRFGGRARLLARLGPEAAEPVDELLSAALRHAETHPPSLQHFLHWLRRSEESIKREPDAAGDAVRVMTVHGAKGLQARLVVLPDTTGNRPIDETLLWDKAHERPPHGSGTDPVAPALRAPLWVPRAELGSAPTRRLRDRMRADSAAETNRLLYVALTRAADRLVVCGWESGRRTEGGAPEGSWYALCRAGFEAAGAVPAGFDAGWPGDRLVLARHETTTRRDAPTPAAAPVPPSPPIPVLPAWAGHAPFWRAPPPPAEPVLPRPLAPSRPDDVELGPVPASRSPLESNADPMRGAGGFRRGRLVHALLQHLPDLPPDKRDEAALRFLQAGPDGLDPADAADAAGRLRAVLAHPELAPLFAPGSLAEQPVSGLADGVVVTGRIDRMQVLPDRVLLCDFKTNRRTPAAPEQAPVAYLRQMAAYRALLQLLYPGRPIRCALVWTEDASVMLLPDALLEAHRPRTYRPFPHAAPALLDQPVPVAHLGGRAV